MKRKDFFKRLGMAVMVVPMLGKDLLLVAPKPNVLVVSPWEDLSTGGGAPGCTLQVCEDETCLQWVQAVYIEDGKPIIEYREAVFEKGMLVNVLKPQTVGMEA